MFTKKSNYYNLVKEIRKESKKRKKQLKNNLNKDKHENCFLNESNKYVAMLYTYIGTKVCIYLYTLLLHRLL